MRLTWMAPVTGGPAERYIIEAFDLAGRPLATFDTGNASTTFTHGAVGRGAYAVRIRAANAAGIGGVSDLIQVVVP